MMKTHMECSSIFSCAYRSVGLAQPNNGIVKLLDRTYSVTDEISPPDLLGMSQVARSVRGQGGATGSLVLLKPAVSQKANIFVESTNL